LKAVSNAYSYSLALPLPYVTNPFPFPINIKTLREFTLFSDVTFVTESEDIKSRVNYVGSKISSLFGSKNLSALAL
jgi:hypothetical protein